MSNDVNAQLAEMRAMLELLASENQALKASAEAKPLSTTVISHPVRYQSEANKTPSIEAYIQIKRFSAGRQSTISIPMNEVGKVVDAIQLAAKQPAQIVETWHSKKTAK